MKYVIIVITLCCTFTALSAQYDTIAGPFENNIPLANLDNKVYMSVYDDQSNRYQVISANVDAPEEPTQTVFTNPFSNSITDYKVVGNNMYAVSAEQTVQTGRVYLISDLDSPNPNANFSYLTLPWFPTRIAVRDSTLYISRFFFFGGGIFTYDMTDPDAELEFLIETPNNPNTALEFHGDVLVAVFGDQNGQVATIDVTDADNPVFSTRIPNLDNPGGFTIREDKIYVSVRNATTNLTSRVYVYEWNNGQSPQLIEELAEDLTNAVVNVIFVGDDLYYLEISTSAPFPELPGYLLRDQITPSTNRNIFTVQRASVFPNPTQGQLNLEEENIVSVRIIAANGKRFKTFKSPGNQLDLTGIPAGVYSVLLYLSDGSMKMARVVKY